MSPFPGMDPFLEAKHLWPSFHHLFADRIMVALNAVLSEKYYADVNVRIVWEEATTGATTIMIPDTSLLDSGVNVTAPTATMVAPPAPLQRIAMIPEPNKVRSVELKTVDGDELVTAIEILSPVNKRGRGLEEYRRKRRQILQSDVHLVEFDFLRGGTRPGWEVNEPSIDTDYIVLVNRAFEGDLRQSEIWPVALDEPLPLCPIPLLPPDPAVTLDLMEIVRTLYQQAVYARRIDYAQPIPTPKLRPLMAKWWDALQA